MLKENSVPLVQKYEESEECYQQQNLKTSFGAYDTVQSSGPWSQNTWFGVVLKDSEGVNQMATTVTLIFYVYTIFTLLPIRVGKVFHWSLLLIVFSKAVNAMSSIPSSISIGEEICFLTKMNLIILFHFRAES